MCVCAVSALWKPLFRDIWKRQRFWIKCFTADIQTIWNRFKFGEVVTSLERVVYFQCGNLPLIQNLFIVHTEQSWYVLLQLQTSWSSAGHVRWSLWTLSSKVSGKFWFSYIQVYLYLLTHSFMLHQKRTTCKRVNDTKRCSIFRVFQPNTKRTILEEYFFKNKFRQQWRAVYIQNTYTTWICQKCMTGH